ncbi:YDG domain-containing protein [Selenomonas sp. AE3005]|uniref:YDG domain-containing protein n=1 Tax=Selenomonas sp. AE3005 TaxID=1485543 RepID=UPI00047F4ECE|nr:YDG domain-containing protein [Selenomonas sp. AE3005]
MRRDSNQQKIAIAVGIALSAGMFSIVPVAYGAPVGGTVTTGGADIAYSDAANGGKDTSITSTTMNNVIDWQDFSVAKGEKVVFDGETTDPTQGAHNYMNIVSGMNTSQIDGAIKGGNEVYIINPNGVIFGETASVDVGSLYASTRGVTDTVKGAIAANGTTMESVINTASAGVATDVVNMGKISANKVVMEGQNVRFLNDSTVSTNSETQATELTPWVKANSVILKADSVDGGYVHVGNYDGASAGDAYKTMSIRNNATDVDENGHSVLTTLPPTNYYQLVDGNNWSTTIATNLSGNYMLRSDIVATDEATTFTPITETFKGNFDGNFHTISGMKAKKGLFAKTSGKKRIENVGVVGSEIENDSREYAGAIAGEATDTTFNNVFNEGTSVKVSLSGVIADGRAGGLVGKISGVKINESYNNGQITGHGLVAQADSSDSSAESTIKNSYSIGELTSTGMGFVGAASSSAIITIENCYAKSYKGAAGNGSGIKIKNSIVYGLGNGTRAYGGNTGSSETQPYTSDLKYKDSYTGIDVGWTSITNIGGVKPNENGEVTRSIWRIYEGQDMMPVLTSFLKGVKTVNYNYGYFDDDGLNKTVSVYGGSNGIGSNTKSTYTDAAGNTVRNADDIPAFYGEATEGLVYNGKTLKILNKDQNGAATDSSTIQFAQQDIAEKELSHIKYDTAGRKNSTYDGSKVNSWAMIYSDQLGYDIAGGNISIAPRSVPTKTTTDSYMIARAYNGSYDASDDVANVFTGETTSTTGILPEDEGSVKVRYSGTATFQSYNSNTGAWTDDANVGIDKRININGNLSLASITTNTDGTTTTSDYTENNYTLVNSAGEYVNSVTLPTSNVKGVIYQRELIVKAAKDDYEKVYDKNSTVKIKDETTGEYIARTITADDFDFDTSQIVSLPSANNAAQTVADDVELDFGETANYVISANDSSEEAVSAGNHAVRLNGVKLKGAARDNYVLVYEDSTGNRKNIFSTKGLIELNREGEYEQGTAINPENEDGTGGGGNVYSTGVINRRNISSTGFEWYTGDENNKTWHNNSATAGAATREYTGSENYAEPVGTKVSNERNSTVGSGMLEGDSLLFTVQSATFVKSAAWEDTDENGKSVNHTYSTTKNVNTDTQVGAQGVVYTVTISDNGTGVANNYTLDGQDIVANGNTVIGAGAITPRTLNVVVNPTKNVTKQYDGNANVKDAAGETTFGMDDGYLSYANAEDTEHHLLTNDGSHIKITGLYQQTGLDGAAKNVNYTQNTTQNGNTTTTTYTVADKNIVYEAKVYEGTGDSAVISQNYKFGENGSATQTFDGIGQITPATITAVTFKTAEKTYDGDYNVTNSTSEAGITVGQPTYKNDRITITGVTGAVNNEGIQDVFGVDENGQLALNSEVLKGQYGEMADGVFTPNADVLRAASHEVIENGKTVEYMGLGNLLNTRNYILADNLSEKAYGTGTIRPLKITDGEWIKLDRNSTPITKVYDGTKNVAHAMDYLTDRQAYVQPTGTTNELGLNLTVAGAEYSSQHQGTRDVTYKLVVTETGNYSIADSLLTNGYVEKTLTGGGIITPRAITIIDNKDYVNDDIVDHNITKTYDALPDIERTGEELITIKDQLVTDVDTAYVVSNGITAVYNDKNAGSKVVTYTLKVAGDTEGDYYFRAENSDTHRTTWTGEGTIYKRTLTLNTTAEPSKVYGTYDDDVTTNRLESVKSSTMPTAEVISFGSDENKTVVNRDGFDVTKLTGLYGSGTTDDTFVANGDVNRATDTNRTVLNKDVQYSGVLAALGDDAGNYDVANTFYGIGKITPATIDHTAFKFYISDSVSQTYSGSEVVGEYGMDATARNAFQRSWVNPVTSGVDLDGNGAVDISLADGAYDYSINSAKFNSADAGEGNKTVTYNVHVDAATINNYDYADDAVAIDAIDLTDSSNTGTINKRSIIASVTHDYLEKYYDGTKKIYNGDNAAYSGAASGTELSGADAVTFAAVVADGTTTQTGLLDGTNVSTGAYDDAGVGTNNKTINYTAKVDDAHSGNYKFVDAEGHELTNGQGTALTTTQNTINPFGVVLTTADTTKTYDGTKGVKAVKSTAALQLGNSYDNLQLTDVTDDTGVYDNPNVQNGAAHTVTYTGFTLNNDNYYLAKADGSAIDTEAGKNVITGTGYIEKYTLTALPTFTIHDVTKEYDTDALVKYNRSSDADAIKRNFITATNLPGDIAYELVKAEYTDSARGVGKTVNFILQLSSDNYNFGSLVNNGWMNADGTFAKSGTGDITPRKVYVSLDTTPEIRKTYDGDTGVEQDVTNMIIVRDGDLLNEGTHLNRNASVINAQYEDKDAGDNKKVIYQVQLTGNGADNYEIHRLENLGTNADSVYNTLEGTGKIDKATLTFNPDDHAFDRDYRKGDANVGLNAGSVVLTGVNGETVTLNDGALNKVTAEFGKGTGANDFTADENVSWNGDNVVDKDIRFTGLDNALQYMVDNNVDTISKNYTIDGTAYFAAAKAKGKIKPITITQAATENWKAVTREYNADTDLQEVYDYSGATAEPLGINDILTFTLTHDGNTVTDSNGNALTVRYTAAGQYDNQNVGDNHTLNYHINSVESKVKDAVGNANYILDDSVLTALVNHDVDSGAANNAGNAAVYSHITPRQLNAAVEKDSGNRKIYDGNDRADTSNFVVDADDQAILSKDGLLNDVVITARYGDKHASVNPGEADSNSKTITYTLALNDNSGNYAIATPSAVAQGDIERRKVYVDGTNAVAAPKDYDGNTDLPSGTDYNAMGFGLRDADSTTGLVTGDSDLKLDATQVEGHYVSPDVKRAADGSVIAQNINFTGFKLNDTDTANDNSINDYIMIDANGSGVIKPLPVSVSIAAAPYKAYDGTTTVKGTAAANANLVPSGLLTGDSANILIGSADYDDASAGTNKGYTYNITLGNGNYTLVQGSNAPDITVTGNGLKGQIKASDGTIDKRIITPTVNGIMTKVYDGTTAGTENAAASVSLSNVLSGDNVGLTAKAVYDNPNAGTAEDSDGLQNHKVTYKLNLSNPNYQLAEDTITGTGTISRKGLTIVATPVSINSGEAMPKFSGTVEGLVSGDENLASSFVFDTMPTVTNTSVEKPNPVYGWYRNQTSGNFGLNYTFDQDAANDTAFTVKYVDSGRNNPDTKITPTNNIYQQISKDKGSGFGDNAAAALEYVDKNGQVIARETIDSGEIHDGSVSLGNADDMTSQDTSLANIGIVGGDIVNVDGADAANMANIEVTDNGTTVNLEITSLSSGESGDKQAVAEITSVPAAADNSSAQIQNLDDRQDILEQLENKDKDEEKKDSEIAIESQNNQNDDEIELKIEGSGVKVA